MFDYAKIISHKYTYMGEGQIHKKVKIAEQFFKNILIFFRVKEYQFRTANSLKGLEFGQ